MNLPPISILGMIWGVAELVLAIERKVKSRGHSKDRGSLFWIWIVYMVCIPLGVVFAYRLRSLGLPSRYMFYWAGFWLFISGAVFRWYAILYLGRFFTPDVTILDEHRLIQTGPYRYIRHPTYSGALLAVLGLTLTMGNLASILAIFVPILIVMLWRINIEESALTDAFGDQYRRYVQRTKRLLPLLY